tara:strand:+ start:1457 stop:1813 length:357 start_codon:yes stop_codon:yes gene_type:complete
MRILWESNSRSKHLAATGKINGGDIISRMKTSDFPSEAATVRMHKPREKKPSVTLHIRGKVKHIKNPHGYTYANIHTCRVNFGGRFGETMCSNGLLDEDLTWQDVHDLVVKVKNVMDI